MQFECNGIRKGPGVFASFDDFRDFRSWVCGAFGLGPSMTAFVTYYDTKQGKWVALDCLRVEFVFSPYYIIAQPNFRGGKPTQSVIKFVTEPDKCNCRHDQSPCVVS